MDKLEELGWKKRTTNNNTFYTKPIRDDIDEVIEIDNFCKTVELYCQHWNKNKKYWYYESLLLEKEELLALAEILKEDNSEYEGKNK